MPPAPQPDLDPGPIFTALERHGVRYVVIGAVAAIAQGYPLNTGDLDVTPARDAGNLERLAAALVDLDARLRVPNDPAGVEFPIDADYLSRAESWTLTTRYGDLDVLFEPSGTRGYDDLRRQAVTFDIGGTQTAMASLLDIIRMKEAAGRPKDLAQLPALRQTLEIVRVRERRNQS
jgi:hypothetical protein